MFETLIVRPMGFIIKLIYDLIPNYGVALILFTIFIKLLIFPLNLKSQKSMIKQQKLAPQLAELQKKYANDKEKLNKEMMELYRANGANPASGCLPMLLQFPIIIALFRVIQKPLSYILQIDFSLQSNLDRVAELQAAVSGNEALSAIAKGQELISASAETLVNNLQITMAQFASNPLVEGFSDWVINFDFLGLDLSRYPSEAMGVVTSLFTGRLPANWLELLPLLSIPALAGLTSWLLSKMSQNSQPRPQTNSSSQPDQAAQMTKSMSLMMPIMSIIFTFTLPCGIGLYWTVSNVFQMVQQAITVKVLKKKEENIDVINTIKPNRKDLKKYR